MFWDMVAGYIWSKMASNKPVFETVQLANDLRKTTAPKHCDHLNLPFQTGMTLFVGQGHKIGSFPQMYKGTKHFQSINFITDLKKNNNFFIL